MGVRGGGRSGKVMPAVEVPDDGDLFEDVLEYGLGEVLRPPQLVHMMLLGSGFRVQGSGADRVIILFGLQAIS